MDEKELIEWKENSRTFDTVAEDYERFRPDYPEELVSAVIAGSRIPKNGHILEIGCGTGKATRLFAQHGYSIHCVEPGENLAAIASKNLRRYPKITFEIGRFEECEVANEGYDLAISAQAFHWVPKEIGFAKVASSLKPEGTMALFWNMSPEVESQIERELDTIYKEIAPSLADPKTNTEKVIQERLEDIQKSGWFGPVELNRFSWSKAFKTEEFTGLISTYSDHIRLPAETQNRLLNAIAKAINAHGGRLVKNYVAVLYLAKKLAR